MAGSLVNFSEHYKVWFDTEFLPALRDSYPYLAPQPLVDVAFSLAAIADIYIACVLCYFLKDSRRDVSLGYHYTFGVATFY